MDNQDSQNMDNSSLSPMQERLEKNIQDLERRLSENSSYQTTNPVLQYRENLTQQHEEQIEARGEERIKQVDLQFQNKQESTESNLDEEKISKRELISILDSRINELEKEYKKIDNAVYRDIWSKTESPKLQEIRAIGKNVLERMIYTRRTSQLNMLYETAKRENLTDSLFYKAKNNNGDQNQNRPFREPRIPYQSISPVLEDDVLREKKARELKSKIYEKINNNEKPFLREDTEMKYNSKEIDISELKTKARKLSSTFPDPDYLASLVNDISNELRIEISDLKFVKDELENILRNWHNYKREEGYKLEDEKSSKLHEVQNLTDKERDFAQKSIDSSVSAVSQGYNPAHLQTVLENEQANLDVLNRRRIGQ